MRLFYRFKDGLQQRYRRFRKHDMAQLFFGAPRSQREQQLEMLKKQISNHLAAKVTISFREETHVAVFSAAGREVARMKRSEREGRQYIHVELAPELNELRAQFNAAFIGARIHFAPMHQQLASQA